jgi:hypothetical protein
VHLFETEERGWASASEAWGHGQSLSPKNSSWLQALSYSFQREKRNGVVNKSKKKRCMTLSERNILKHKNSDDDHAAAHYDMKINCVGF